MYNKNKTDNFERLFDWSNDDITPNYHMKHLLLYGHKQCSDSEWLTKAYGTYMWHENWGKITPSKHHMDFQQAYTQTSRKTQPHVAQNHWIGSETDEHRSFQRVEEGSLSTTLAFDCGTWIHSKKSMPWRQRDTPTECDTTQICVVVYEWHSMALNHLMPFTPTIPHCSLHPNLITIILITKSQSATTLQVICTQQGRAENRTKRC